MVVSALRSHSLHPHRSGISSAKATSMAKAASTKKLRPAPRILSPTSPVIEKESNTVSNNPKDVFICDEESHFYSQCLDKLVVKRCRGRSTVLEFGAGHGGPVIASLAGSVFQGTVHGYEINERAAAMASRRAVEARVHNLYKIHSSCFFKAVRNSSAKYLVANPPYIPAPDNRIMMPALHGGHDGAELTRTLISLGLENVMLLISSYSNPVATLRHAQKEGYRVVDFLIAPMPFGTYSSEPKVKQWIAKMKMEAKAFYTGNSYLLAGVLLQKREAARKLDPEDLTDPLLAILTALH